MSPRSLLALLLGAFTGCVLGVLPVLQSQVRQPEITFIPRTSGTNLTEGMHRGARRAAQEAGFRLYWNAPTREDDVDRQIHLMLNALHDGTKGLILGPTNGLALTSTINEFTARGIPTVVVQTDPPVPAGAYVASVTPDQMRVSQLAAKRILSLVGEGDIAIVGLDRTAPETMERARNFASEMSAHPGFKIVAQQKGTSLVPEAEQNTGEVLDTFPKLRAIFAVSATATEGAVLAIQKRSLGRAVLLVGCDSDLFLMADLSAGKLDSLVAFDGDEMGYRAAKILIAAIQGKRLPPPQHMPVQITVSQGPVGQ